MSCDHHFMLQRDAEAAARLAGHGPTLRASTEPVYHVTVHRRLGRIARAGLRPGQPGSIGGPAYDAHRRGRIFLTDAAGVFYWLGRAVLFAEHGSDRPMKDRLAPVVLRLRVPPPGMEEDLIGTRDALAPAWISTVPIPARLIEVWDGRAWLPVARWREVDHRLAFRPEKNPDGGRPIEWFVPDHENPLAHPDLGGGPRPNGTHRPPAGTQTFWHVAGPWWKPGQPLRSFNALVRAGVLKASAWRWEHPRRGSIDAQVVSLWTDREEALYFMEEAPPGSTLVEVRLPSRWPLRTLHAYWDMRLGPWPPAAGVTTRHDMNTESRHAVSLRAIPAEYVAVAPRPNGRRARRNGIGKGPLSIPARRRIPGPRA